MEGCIKEKAHLLLLQRPRHHSVILGSRAPIDYPSRKIKFVETIQRFSSIAHHMHLRTSPLQHQEQIKRDQNLPLDHENGLTFPDWGDPRLRFPLPRNSAEACGSMMTLFAMRACLIVELRSAT